MQATDADITTDSLPVWYRLAGWDNSPFDINTETGVIYAYSELDRESVVEYQVYYLYMFCIVILIVSVTL